MKDEFCAKVKNKRPLSGRCASQYPWAQRGKDGKDVEALDMLKCSEATRMHIHRKSMPTTWRMLQKVGRDSLESTRSPWCWNGSLL